MTIRDNLWRRFVGGKGVNDARDLPFEFFANMSASEIGRWYATAPPELLTMHTYGAVYRRLTDLAFFAHGLTDAERESANKLRVALKRDIVAFLEPNPSGLEAFHAAADHQESGIPYIGVGSLNWLIEEHGIPAEQICDFVMRPGHGPLLTNYLHTVGTEAFFRVRSHLIRELVRQRRDNEFPNLVFHVSALLHCQDQGAICLFTSKERMALLAARDDYESARLIFVHLGLLPPGGSFERDQIT